MRSLSVVLSCLVAVACLLPAALWALPSGAPVAACYSELPGHGGAEPQASLSPYAIQATPGVLLTARDAHTGELLHGTFTPDAQTRTLDCPGGNANAITHNSRDYKTQVVVTWTAPAGYSGQVYFR
ncbi:hypothetical protein HPB49_016713 [Dermacentor silvarum]|uniref:Uncharacterized protein n=1 Tax=Dermacentor silvarum TaxID=543639 RepID=A0ACB8DKG1_DERSI|nr:hypothetical protein HPB49_016713 [Dermacentor silvarum]